MSHKIKAYQVQGDEYGCIVFATNSATARREGGRELDLEFSEVESCRRAQWADEYADAKGGVPQLVMIKNGWWQECVHCGHRITIDDIEDGYEDDDGNVIKLNPVEKDHHIYCNQHCFDKEMEQRANHDAKADEFKNKVLSLRPDLTFKEFRGKWPQCYCSASFTFDGAQCGGIVSYGTDGEVEWRISQRDLNAWDTYEIKRKGGAA
jgi:hypothetical protein